jgi:hypothetical protein
MNQTNKKEKHFIYCLEFYDEYNEKTGERDGVRRYIGRTTDLNRRWKQHRNMECVSTRMRNFEKCRFILEDVGDENNYLELEQKWIDYYGINNLLNKRNEKKRKVKKSRVKKESFIQIKKD